MKNYLKTHLPEWILKRLRNLRSNIYDIPVMQKVNKKHFSRKFDYNRSTGKIRVTIFGSCRQDSISKHFKTSSIRDGLTYPHYTKEIVQAIKYVQSKGAISPKDEGVFRNHQIGLPIRSLRRLHKDFIETDVFVVEIASRISYEYNGDYFHHFAYDNPIGPSGARITDAEIVTRYQQDDEIRTDMTLIKSLLSPKPVIFVTHFCTYSNGSRAELRDLVTDQAHVLECTVFDPSQMLINYPVTQLVEPEPVISHFSQFGHEVLAGRYQLMILESYLVCSGHESQRTINQILDSTPTRVEKFSATGIGDSGLGLAFLYRYAIANGRVPGVNAKNYFTSRYLKFDEEQPTVDIGGAVKMVFHESPESAFQETRDVFTNKRFSGAWDVKMRDFIISKMLTPTSEFAEIVEQTKTNLKLGKTYETIHIRFGDSSFKASSLDDVEFKNFRKFLQELAKAYNPSEGYLLMSDSVHFNKLANRIGFITREGPVAHSGHSSFTEEETLGVLLDFFLLSESQAIHQISSYAWGSGFSELASRVFDIPIDRNEFLVKKLKEFS